MKLIKTSVLLLLIVCLTAACSTENKADEEMTNNVALSVVGNAFMNEDDTEGITLHLLIAFAPTKDETINLDIKGNEDEIVHLEQSTIQLKAGQKEATVKVKHQCWEHIEPTHKSSRRRCEDNRQPRLRCSTTKCTPATTHRRV